MRIQTDLSSAALHHRSIDRVSSFGKTGMSWRSEDPACMQDLLACSSFASQPVAAFLLSHSSTVKGVVRDMNKRMTPTESVIATFAGRSHPIKIKAWPLIHRVDMYVSHHMPCRKC
ncbi:unnamed protein product [Ixodes pacificus]